MRASVRMSFVQTPWRRRARHADSIALSASIRGAAVRVHVENPHSGASAQQPSKVVRSHI